MKRIKLKPNIVDFIFIILLVAMSLLIGFRYASDKSSMHFVENVKTDLCLYIESEPMTADLADNVKTGLPLMDAETGERIGIITSFDIRGVSSAKVLQNGESESTEPMYTVSLTVSCPVYYRKGYYTANGNQLLVSNNNGYMIPNLYFKGDCVYFSETASNAYTDGLKAENMSEVK